MNASCNLDVELAHQISALLKPPSPQQVQEYFDELFKARKSVGLKIKHNDEFGKGLYADVEFGEGELVLRDQMLVGAQHTSNKVDCLVCSHCFRFIGSVELQIGRKLYLQDLGLSSNAECASNSLDEEGDLLMEDHNDSSSCSLSDLKKRISLPNETVVSLMNGAIALPYSEQFSLPSAMPCPGGCGEAFYCSKLCADMDWELFHSLLCTGESSASLCHEALLKFIEHANETNDIFLLSAKAIAFTILQYRKLKVAHLGNQKLKQCSALGGMDTSEFSLLLEAWKPISMGFKRRWWECIALPEDVDCCDEASFRMQIKDLASMSLQLLKQAIFDKECAALFTLEIYGHIIGMFELNNLDLVVASPVEDYFLYIDDLLDAEKEVAERITRPFLDALGEDYSVCCQGSAFFPIQSCINHSCYPNAKAFKREEDRDGQATIIALRPISKGEEITISYIDEDQSLEDRRRQLADYGFRCRCPKCNTEEHHEPSLL